jgi:hypothetical protein
MLFNSGGGQADTGTGTGDAGLVTFNVWQHDGGNTASAVAATGNVFAVRNHNTSILIVEGNGDLLLGGSAGSVADTYEDTHLLRAYDYARTEQGAKGLIRSQWDDYVKYNEETLIEAGVLGMPLAEGGLVNVTQLQRLQNGAIWQLYTKLMDTESRLARTENKLLALEAG